MLAWRYEFYVLVARTISHSYAALTCEILFLPLEHKIHIFSPPCNILYFLIDSHDVKKQKLVDSWLAADWDFDQVLIKTNRGVDWILKECWSRALITEFQVQRKSVFPEGKAVTRIDWPDGNFHWPGEGRQHGRVVRALDFESRGHKFKSHSDH